MKNNKRNNKNTIKTDTKNVKNFSIINFNSVYEPPTYKWNKAKSWITWGNDNNYPKYLLDLYNSNGASLNTSIINKKVSYLTGKGIQDSLDVNLQEFIDDNELEDQLIMASYDYEIFNGFAFEIVWSLGGQIKSIKHFPLAQLRFGLITGENHLPYFWYSADWKNTRQFEPIAIRSYNEDFPIGTQIYYYSTYNPANTLVNYPIPMYSNSLNAIETDYVIDCFHLNQGKQGYSPSFLLNFATGIPTPEEQDEFYENFKDNYSGTENAGNVIITYSDNELQKPTFQKIDLNDSDERFLMLNDRIQEKIVVGHDIPASLLILTAGKLSGSAEGPEKVKEFKEGYILTRQKRLESVINKMLKHNNYTEELKIKKDEVVVTIE